MLFRVNTVAITGRVKDNSAEIKQMLVIIWWALNQAVVVEVKSICLHRSYRHPHQRCFVVHMGLNLFLQ